MICRFDLEEIRQRKHVTSALSISPLCEYSKGSETPRFCGRHWGILLGVTDDHLGSALPEHEAKFHGLNI
jgi:hypothetical protein